MDKKRKIKILTPGGIPGKAFVNGPILTPYYEKESVIFNLISKGVEVIEVLDNGNERKLTVNDLKNTEPVKKVEKPKVEVKEEVVKETTEVVEEVVSEKSEVKVIDEVVQETTEVVEDVATDENVEKTEPTNNYNKKYKNKQQNKYHNKDVQVDELKEK